MKKLKIFSKPTKESIRTAVKLSMALALLTIVFIVVYFSTGPSLQRLYEGDVSLKDIYAPYDFTYTGDVDEEKMDLARELAFKAVAPVYALNIQIIDAASETISAFFTHVRESRKVRELIGDDQKIEDLKITSNLKLSDQSYSQLVKTGDIDYIESNIKEIVGESLNNGILSNTDKDSLKSKGIDEIEISNPKDGVNTVKSVKDIATVDDFIKELPKTLAARFSKDKKIRPVVTEIIKVLMLSNLQFDFEETKRRKVDIELKIPNVYKQVKVKKNELLIGKGEKIAKKHLDMLTPLGRTLDIGGRLFYLIGMALLLIIFLLIFVFHLRFYESKIFRDNKNLILISLLVILIAVLSETVVMSPLSSYLIPLACASMLIGILLDANSAFIFTIIMSIFAGLVAGNNFGLMIVMFTGSSVGIYSIRKVRRRSGLLIGGLLVGAANFFTITAMGFLNNLDPRLFFGEAMLGIGNGLISFMLVIGILPVLEYLFKIPTDITLLELSDLNHPLLKAMATKAPGTYHHSLIVGNLAEAACDAIGANSLLARVGAYYHDIGKIEKAEYFSENEGEPKNSRHENLTPTMSALVIINHVKDGIEQAQKHKLNQALIDFIAQHHGNGLIYFFYQRALERVEDEKEIKEEEFRYPGPRPQSKEAAIVLLADSVEASSRTLGTPTPSRVQGLVQRIVNNKFIDGQLDECNLTLKDLHKITEAFMRILNAMFHTRVEYPREDDKKKLKNNHKKPVRDKDLNEKLNKEDSKEDS